LSESSYDVYVHEGHIVEVARSEQATVAQVFGEDWQAQPIVNLHAKALASSVEKLAQPVVPVADPTKHMRLGLKISLGFAVLLTLCLWLVLR
jgi:hypothetical protein